METPTFAAAVADFQRTLINAIGNAMDKLRADVGASPSRIDVDLAEVTEFKERFPRHVVAAVRVSFRF
jgi:hypothetical protein